MDAHERLEVEDEDERQKRLGQLLMKINQTGEKSLNVSESSVTLPINRVADDSTTTPVEPPTELLDRVRQFLPQLEESNASLSGRDKDEFDIENVSDSDTHYIEMNLGLGVFEYERRGPRSDDSSSGSSSSSSMSECNSEESDSGSSGSSSCSEDDAQVAVRPKKPLPRRGKQCTTIPNKLDNVSGGPFAFELGRFAG